LGRFIDRVIPFSLLEDRPIRPHSGIKTHQIDNLVVLFPPRPGLACPLILP
jgi:hypothetical protein